MKKIVIALGGNALGNTPEEQLNLVQKTTKTIIDFIIKGYEVIITHGNGPQVGLINLAFAEANKVSNLPLMPFPECGAMSQGYIGYHLQNALYNELSKRKINKKVATIITQVLVDKNDSAFSNPSKPVGPFYSKEDSIKLAKEKGYTMIEDANRGYRRVVPSPKPIDILELDIIKSMLKENHIVITVGGGGIPVIKENGKYSGVAAVIDKDLASSTLANLIDADVFLILTAVSKIAINYNKQNQINLDFLSVNEAKQYINENQFAKGSMLEKVLAAINFCEGNKSRVAIIGALQDAANLIEGNAGTKITL